MVNELSGLTEDKKAGKVTPVRMLVICRVDHSLKARRCCFLHFSRNFLILFEYIDFEFQWEGKYPQKSVNELSCCNFEASLRIRSSLIEDNSLWLFTK